MNSKQRLAIILSALAALVALLVVLPVFAVDATTRFPNQTDTTKVVTWVRQGGTLMLEVADADLNVGTEVTLGGYAECAENTPANVFSVNRFTPSNTTGFVSSTAAATSTAPVAPPILDKNGDGFVTFADVTLVALNAAAAGLAVDSVDAVNGSINIHCRAAVGNMNYIAGNQSDGGKFNLVFNVGTINATAAGTGAGSVKIASDNDSAGIQVRLEETNANSGVFRGVARLRTTASMTTSTCLTTTAGVCTAGDEASAGSKLGVYTTTTVYASGIWSVGDLRVNAADTVVITYVDGTTGSTINRSAAIKVETTPPSFTNLTPAHDTASTDIRPTVTANISDTDAGVDSALIQVVWGRDTNNDGIIDTVSGTGTNTVASIDQTAIAGGFSIRQRYPVDLTADQVLYWWIKSTDAAGNVGISDRQPLTTAGVADPCDVTAFLATTITIMNPVTGANIQGCQPFAIKIDRRAPTMASAITGSWWDSTLATDDKTVTDPTKAKNTSIRVDFDGALNASTVQLSDFRVNGAAPLSAEVFPGRPQSVFLTVPAMAPEARPRVEIVGVDPIRDLAGNALVVGAAGSIIDPIADGIAPTLTLTVGSGARPVTKDKATLSLSSNENASTATVLINVQRVGASTAPDTTAATTTIANPAGGPRVWTTDVTPGSAGLYNVNAQATDLNNSANVGKVGQGFNISTIDLTTATIFEVDKGLPAPAFLPTAGGTDDRNAVVSINFVNEGQEYGLAVGNVLSLDPTVAKVTNFDTFKTVTVNSATLDGVNITSQLSSVDNIRFLYKQTGGLTLGDHTLVVKATDVAGNTATFTHTFKVIERVPLSIPLVPGWNMVSFPGTPETGSINSVFGTTPVTTVMAYDPSTPALWRVATRANSSAPFTGTLTTIDSKLGYWVLTETFQPISVLIPRIAGGAAAGATPIQPPTLNILKGWNLVPVLDVTGNLVAGNTITVATYFAGLTITRIYVFDTLAGQWTVVAAGGTVEVGKSYWVYASASGTLVP